ncbi:MAG: family 20 glycosylhydrolase, partial [Chitinophagaceae bacterium]|nr:family 20 glycosylhydrolase [Chitinophagaceae bacterium]
TDDQGWRIEIKKYPQLTTVGGWRNGTITGRYPGNGNDKQRYGGFYTQAEIKEVVKYAADRYIQVIPEIEMPGHASAAIAAYPQLSCFPDAPTFTFYPKDCEWNGPVTGKQVQQTWGVFEDVFCAGNDSTFIFLQNVLDEVLALFPSKYIHVGGDECPKDNWKKCPRCQDRMRREGLTDEHHLQSYFIQRIEKHLNAKGRTLIGWDEILEGGLAPNAVVMSWRGEEGGITAAREKHNVIMSPGNPVYFDHTQSENEDSVTIGGFNPLEKVYAYDPVPAKLQSPFDEMILGAQANVWTEYMHNPSKVEYMVFPRMAALSEVLWSKKENRDWKSFELRLGEQIKRYELWKANYSKAYFDLKITVLPADDNKGLLLMLTSKSKGAYYFGEKLHVRASVISTPKPTFFVDSMKLKINESGSYIGWLFTGEDPAKSTLLALRELVFYFNKATGKKITLTNPASDKYPGDGAFTLVNGVQNNKGFARSKEFLGFSGTDCEAVIDLGTSQSISNVSVRCLKRTSSWIWPPAGAEVFGSADGQTWTSLKQSSEFSIIDAATGNGGISLSFPATSVRYIKVLVKNNGIIPAGNPGAGNKAWLFVDEIIAE